MWTPINGYDIPYRANEEGKVQRKTRSGLWLYMKPGVRKNGWTTFCLRKNGRSVQVNAARLIYETFRGSVPIGRWIRYRDGRRSNIALSNLYVKEPEEYTPKRGEIEKIGPDGSVIETYSSMVDAAQDSFCDRSTVRHHCNGDTKDRFGRMGFSFRYKGEEEND